MSLSCSPIFFISSYLILSSSSLFFSCSFYLVSSSILNNSVNFLDWLYKWRRLTFLASLISFSASAWAALFFCIWMIAFLTCSFSFLKLTRLTSLDRIVLMLMTLSLFYRKTFLCFLILNKAWIFLKARSLFCKSFTDYLTFFRSRNTLYCLSTFLAYSYFRSATRDSSLYNSLTGSCFK